MHEIYELKEKLMKELEEYGKKEMSAGSLDVVDKLAHTIKNICKIIESADEESGYSQRGYSRIGEGGGNRYSYEGSGGYSREGNSYARGRGRNAARDSMGRYSRMGGYSRSDGVEEMVEAIRGMMQELPQEVQQDAQRFVQKLEQQM